MKKLILATALTLALTACTQPPQETVSTEPDVTVHAVGGEDLSTEVSSVESDSSPNYRDEGSTSSDVPFVRNHFNVQRVPGFNTQDQITIQKITEGPMVINEITVNRGRCALLTKPDPTTMDYSSRMTVYLWGCGAEDVLEVRIDTDQGFAEYGF